MNVHVGTAAWTIPREFASSFPDDGSQLEKYSQVFNCVEINSSFNKIHLPRTYEKWGTVTPEDFAFSIKLHRSFTHESELRPSLLKLRENLKDISHLGNKWKVLLLQFPGKSQFHELKMARFYEAIRKVYDGGLVVEPRHLSWISAESQKLMKEFKISKVIADPERCPHKNVKVLKSGGLIYYRLHGSPVIYRSSYSKAYLDDLKSRISGKKNVWCIFDNTTFGAATGNALTMLG